MKKLSIQPMQLAVRGALPPRLPQHVLARHRACLSTTSARCCRSGDDASSGKTTSTSTAPATQSSRKLAAVETESRNPELPKFSLDGLGVSKNIKIFLIVVLSIFGTMETWFYCKAIWRWWYGEQGLAVTIDDK